MSRFSPASLSRREFFAFPLLAWWPFRREPNVAGVRFQRKRRGRSAWRFLHIHGDETTAREVLLEFLTRRDGEAFLIRNGSRNVRIQGLQLDPNRMFSREGAVRSLRRLNPDASPAAIDAVLARLDRDRPKILKPLLPPPGGILVALHNNNRGYSMETEIPISEAVHRPDPDNPADFFLVTNPDDFRLLQSGPFNAVLQAAPPPPDDGSFSREAVRLRLRYINIEVALGGSRKQMEMLQFLLDKLPGSRLY